MTAIRPGERITIRVKGISHYQGAASACEAGDLIDLVPEPENPYDRYAVRVDCRGKRIGYIPKDLARDIQPLVQDRKITARIAAVIGEHRDDFHIGVAIELLYKQLDRSHTSSNHDFGRQEDNRPPSTPAQVKEDPIKAPRAEHPSPRPAQSSPIRVNTAGNHDEKTSTTEEGGREDRLHPALIVAMIIIGLVIFFIVASIRGEMMMDRMRRSDTTNFNLPLSDPSATRILTRGPLPMSQRPSEVSPRVVICLARRIHVPQRNGNPVSVGMGSAFLSSAENATPLRGILVLV